MKNLDKERRDKRDIKKRFKHEEVLHNAQYCPKRNGCNDSEGARVDTCMVTISRTAFQITKLVRFLGKECWAQTA